MDIPISVFPPSPFLVFKPFIDFGFVEINKKTSKILKIKNEGLKPGEVTFIIPDKSEFIVDPTSIFIESGGTEEVSITIHPTKE